MVGSDFADERPVYEPLCNDDASAQIHPANFTKALVQAAISAGNGRDVDLRLGTTVEKFRVEQRNGFKRVTGVWVTSSATADESAGTECLQFIGSDGSPETLNVVIAAGVWSSQISAGLGFGFSLVPVLGQSLVLRVPPDQLPPFCIEAEAREVVVTADGPTRVVAQVLPKIVPRADGQVWVGSTHDVISEVTLLHEPGGGTDPNPYTIGALRQVCVDVCPSLAGAEQCARMTCICPCTSDGLPLIGLGDEVRGVAVATGLGPFGILCAPAVGQAVAELLLPGVAANFGLDHYGTLCSAFLPNRPSCRAGDGVSI